MKKYFAWFSLVIVFSLALSSCKPAVTTPPAVPEPVVEEPYQVTGSFSVTNDFVLAVYYVEHAIGLGDMHGFVIRDQEWETPVDSQVLGYMEINDDFLGGTFDLNLPLRPEGTFNDVDNNGQEDEGVQIYAVAYWPNLYAGPFAAGDDRSRGWPNYLASVKTDTENKDEVVGGDLLIWSPDAVQQFPTGFGADELLFTADDPVGPVPAGWSLVNLDKEPFSVTKQAELTVTLYEPQDVALKDFSDLSYTQAFDQMFEVVRKEYAFNGVEGKQPDWDNLYAELKPRVEKAEKEKDREAFYEALRDFTWAFKDGHVGLGGGEEYFDEAFDSATAGGYGFAIREFDDGRFVVIYIVDGGPAAAAGIQVGAELTGFNGEPVADAVEKVIPWTLPHSSDFDLHYQKVRYLLRAPLDTQTELTFINPGGQPQTVTLTTVAERDSFRFTSNYRDAPQTYLPVEFEILPSGVGYVRISSNYDDLNLIIRLFEYALTFFEQADVPGIIIDMRYNSGGASLGLAGFLTDQEIPMGQLEYYSEKTGKFEPEGLREKILPNENQYRFDKMALLVAPTCASACEIESYGFSQIPGMVTVGWYPSAGVEAEVARGQFILPDGFALQVPTGRFTLPDGSIFLEGQGVQPTLRVPVDEQTAYSSEDVALQFAERAVLQPLGAGITPSAPPKVNNDKASEAALQAGANFLEDLAREQYETMSQAGETYAYTVSLKESEPLIWMNGWCAKPKETLEDNYKHIKMKFILNGEEIPLDNLALLEVPSGGQYCRMYYTSLTDWMPGEHHLSVEVTFDQAINDGVADYPAGTHIYDYAVYVKP